LCYIKHQAYSPVSDFATPIQQGKIRPLNKSANGVPVQMKNPNALLTGAYGANSFRLCASLAVSKLYHTVG